MSDYIQQNCSILKFDNSNSWVILSKIEQSIKAKIERYGIPLKKWNLKIYRGILTGFNEAFIISNETRKEILNNCKNITEYKRTDELIRPILRGKDIKRYDYSFADLYLINIHNGLKEKNIPRIDINDYPSIKKHLDKHWDKISIRADRGDTPYNLRNCAYMDEFNKPKIVWARLMRLSKSDLNAFPRFCTVPEGYFIVDSLCFFTGPNIETLVQELNSEFAAYYFFNTVATLDNGGFQMRQQYVEEIPLPKINLKSGSIDENIYRAYNFTADEIEYIRKTIKKKKQEIEQLV